MVLVGRASRPVAEDGQLAHDADAVEPGLLVQLAPKPLLERLAGVDAAGGNLRPRLGIVALVEDEQLDSPVTLARDVGQDALPHPCARSLALCSRFAAW